MKRSATWARPARRRERRPFGRSLLLGVLVCVLLLAPSLALADETVEFQKLLAKGWLWTYAGVFAAGIFTSLTPCVYPMVPIVVAIFGAKDTTRGRALFLATMYVFGMSLTFAVLGTIAALAGQSSTGILANPWVVWPLVAFYAALAAAMFGAFELQLPASLQTKLSTVGGKGPWGAFSMGLVGGFTAAPCTGPILLGILALVTAQQASVPVGFTLLFTYGLGIGVLFWAIAVFALVLPKSGAWMEGIKSVGGIALLAIGFYFLRPVVPALVRASSASPIFLGGTLALAMAGIALGAVHLSFHGDTKTKLRKGVAVLLTVVGIAGTVNWALTPKRKPGWYHDEKAAFADAKALAAPMLIDFGAEWCLPCKAYETKIFANQNIDAVLRQRFVSLRFDFTNNSDEGDTIRKRWRAGLPTVILLDSKGKEVRRFGEPIPTPEEFLRALGEVD